MLDLYESLLFLLFISFKMSAFIEKEKYCNDTVFRRFLQTQGLKRVK